MPDDRAHLAETFEVAAIHFPILVSPLTRLMATMAQEGFVVQDPSTRRYMIGPMLFSAGSLYEPAAMYREVSEPILSELAAHGHRPSETARALGLERSHLYKKCQQLGIDLKAERK